jgi:hypothetical protein
MSLRRDSKRNPRDLAHMISEKYEICLTPEEAKRYFATIDESSNEEIEFACRQTHSSMPVMSTDCSNRLSLDEPTSRIK